MAPHSTAISALRAITFRISSATKAELPHIIAHISQSLPSCRSLLSAPETQNQKDSDAALVLARFNAQLSALLQDRSSEGRFAAVVLVKGAIEAGGWETLRKSNAWVRALLAILKKPDPPITRTLCMITLTRIFMLTWEYPTLVREITTPALPTFVSICLSNLTTRLYSHNELRSTLELFAQLIPRHPTIFRTNQDAINKLLQSIFHAPNMTLPADINHLASRVSVLLHQCEPKGGAADKWERSLVATVKASHAVADKTFIAIDEDWQSVAGNNTNKHPLTAVYRASQASKASADGPVQQFVTSGSQALLTNLRVLATYFTLPTPANVLVSIGQTADLITRLLAVTLSQTASKTSVKFNKDSSREERDALAQVLPDIHLAALELLSAILTRYGPQLTATHQTFLDQLVWIFHASTFSPSIKTAVYNIMTQILDQAGPTFFKSTTASLRKLITTCCTDLLPPTNTTNPVDSSPVTNTTNNKPPQSTMNADTFLKAPKTTSSPLAKQTQHPALHDAASTLLVSVLQNLPAKNIPVALRSTLDRTAVLTRNKTAMVASALNPPARDTPAAKAGMSVLPLLAREFPGDSAVEALLRPRMPVLETGRRAHGTAPDDDVIEEEAEEDDILEEDGDDDDDDDEVKEDEDADDGEQMDISDDRTNPLTTTITTLANEAQEGASALQAALSSFTDSKTKKPVDALLGKRPRSPGPDDDEDEVRKKASPAVDASAGAGAATDDDDDDDVFEIPALVMGLDSDDSEGEEA